MSNTDNQMTRFLFAILKQKNLKDIDWNAVARDPILAQPITNGHAARMRYSRFRSSMLGIEPQKRNRTTTASHTNKNKVTKSKKDTTKLVTKKEDIVVKAEPNFVDRLAYSDGHSHSPIKVKHEMTQQPYHATQYTPTSMASPVSQECQPTPVMRLLTPCSDDMLSVAQPLQFSPQANVLGHFDLSSAEPCSHSHDPNSEQSSWVSSPAYSAFEAAYSLHNYGGGLADMCDHQHDPQMENLQANTSLGMAMQRPMEIKNEQWEGHQYGQT